MTGRKGQVRASEGPVLPLLGLLAFLTLLPPSLEAQVHQHGNGDTSLTWQMPRMPGMDAMMLPGMADYRPPLTPFLPGRDVDPASLTEARPNGIVELGDGDTLRLESRLVRRTIRGRAFVMYGFNNQYPGPLIRVAQHTTVVVVFINGIDLPSTIHWHGVRVENRFDGVPGITQELVQPGETFTYHVRFPDAGIYWYHPHHREDIQQELGLYGNLRVDAPEPDYFGSANVEAVLMLDDLLLQGGSIAPFGLEAANNVLMGRFGDLFLVNGEPDYTLEVERGAVVRFFLTNVSNTRVFNLSFGDAPLKVVGGDIGRFEREEWVPSVVISPAERYIVEGLFERPGRFALTNRVQAVDHMMGEFYSRVDTLGTIVVRDRPASPDHSARFRRLRSHPAVRADVGRYRPHFGRPPDFELLLSIRVGDLPAGMLQFMAIDTAYFPPVEWNDAMPMMNWVTNSLNTHWVLRDPATGRENMDIDWRVEVGDVAKIRLHNDADAFHPMSHPMHLHGQRFLVVERDGVPNPNFVWKETVLVPVGSTVDLLVDFTNPGRWMLHCHIAEHLESGMMMVIDVEND